MNEANLPATRTTADINALYRRADKGDEQAVSELRDVFDNNPALWEEAGNLATQAENSLLLAAAGSNKLTKEAISKKLLSQKRELAGPQSTVLEKLLVDRIVACWFDLHHADTSFFQHQDEMSIQAAEYKDKYRDRAQKRYLSAIKTLAQVRRLLTPTVQVNIANQQLNTASL